VFQDFVFPAISIAGPEVLERFERHIDQGDPFSPDANKMSLLIHGGGVFMKLDGEGRLAVSDFIRDFAGIADPVSGVGRGDYFQLWEPSALTRMQDETRRERMEQSVRST
jgi:MraZ protein